MCPTTKAFSCWSPHPSWPRFSVIVHYNYYVIPSHRTGPPSDAHPKWPPCVASKTWTLPPLWQHPSAWQRVVSSGDCGQPSWIPRWLANCWITPLRMLSNVMIGHEGNSAWWPECLYPMATFDDKISLGTALTYRVFTPIRQRIKDWKDCCPIIFWWKIINKILQDKWRVSSDYDILTALTNLFNLLVSDVSLWSDEKFMVQCPTCSQEVCTKNYSAH